MGAFVQLQYAGAVTLQQRFVCEPIVLFNDRMVTNCSYLLYYKVLIFASIFQEFITKNDYLKNTISSVPTTIRQSPAKAFFESFSLKTKYEKMTVTMMLSLSMGTTTLTSPFWIA